MRLGILCNGEDLALWQLRAIQKLPEDCEVFLLVSGPDRATKRSLKHAFYYALNLVTMRNQFTKRVQFPKGYARTVDRLCFVPVTDGSWDTLPDEVLGWAKEKRLDAVLKFALGLLRVPAGLPILSFHHGDPRKYRGRPAGFYETLNRERFLGQIIQILGNKLDGGAVIGFAESKVFCHSYRKTLFESYRLSEHLLPVALKAFENGERLDLKPTGHNYRLPGNATVLKFVGRTVWSFAVRLAYGTFVEKKWNVASTYAVNRDDPVQAITGAGKQKETWVVPIMAERYSFFADPFFHTGADDLLMEAMNARTGKGELVRIKDGVQERITGFGGHVSYPSTYQEDGEFYILPETAAWSRPVIFRLEGSSARKVANVNIDEKALLDPTLVREHGRTFLFGNTVKDGPSVLHLWSASSLFGRFEPHPKSPVRVSARGSRMAGDIVTWGSSLYRLGQDFKDRYGDGVLVFRIDDLAQESFSETLVGDVSFDDVCGPHTVNLQAGTLLFDWYIEEWSTLAGVRRILSRLP